MLNLIRADLYRILRGKGFYIATILLVSFIFAQTATNSTGGVVMSSGYTMVSTYHDDGTIVNSYYSAKDDVYYDEIPKFTGSVAPFKMLENADVLLYFLLPFIVFVAAADFSTNTVKNVLANGMPRVKYYFAKLILACIFCLYVSLINIIVPVIAGTILHGFGGTFDMDFILRLLRPFSAQMVMLIGVTCVGLFLVFTTQKTSVINVSYIAFCLIPLLAISFLMVATRKFEFLLDYEHVMNIRMLGEIDTAETVAVIRAFAIGAFYILASTIGGIALFKRSEVK